MDVFSHAVAGAASGAVFGRPLLGAMFGVLPDVVLGLRRREFPNALYNLSHSMFFLLPVGLVSVLLGTGAPLLAVLSHITLDLPTHGGRWAPSLLYPLKARRYSLGAEWEWFNASWRRGFLLTLIWSAVCLSISYV